MFWGFFATVLLGSQKRMGRRGGVWLFISTFNSSILAVFEENSSILAWNFCRTFYCAVITINKMSRIDAKKR